MYNKKIDEKWQEIWEDKQLYKFDKNSEKPKYYALEMFSYPSGAKLHLGHWFNFGPADTYARFKNMQGYNVFHPMGFDAFGLPAENYAIKTGIHPSDSTMQNIKNMRNQLKQIGGTYDWNYTLETCQPEYYKWTQWIFAELYKNGLAYKKNAPVNWCNSCNTVLANEQVLNGECERCGTEIERKKLEQWFFKTTAYAQELLDCLPSLDWPEATKKVQQNWIGRSKGAEVKFKIEGTNTDITVFTTRPDTLFGVTYMVMAPEAEIVSVITTPEYQEKVAKYKIQARKSTDIERMAVDREKTGVFTGAYAINPLNNEKIPVWIADYVLEDYGTGYIMAVPAHDERDFEFAKKYNLPIKQVIDTTEENRTIFFDKQAFIETKNTKLINSDFINDLSVEDAKKEMIKHLEKENIGGEKVNYKLKDWLVSRQRYWGCPIPIVYCDDCGEVLVEEKDLPVSLPYNVEFTPDGDSPLKKSEEFMNCKCPICNKPAKREADTLDTFICSSWYFLRYPNTDVTDKAWDVEFTNQMLPVDVYVGGKEHAAMHLIYARFMTKALRDCGYLDFDEPFKRLVHQGMILGPDGNKMSKSKGNVIAPDEYVSEYGSDVFRMYLMFGFAYTDGGPWKAEGIKAMAKYFNRIENLVDKVLTEDYEIDNQTGDAEKQVLFVKARTIKAMGEDTEKFSFNTSIARSMEYVNELVAYAQNKVINIEFLKDNLKTLVTLLSPFAPHFAEELWEKLGNANSVYFESWPQHNETDLIQDVIEIPVQFNGKVKAVVKVSSDLTDEQVKIAVKENDTVKSQLEGRMIVKEIYVKGKIYNIVVR